MTQLQPYIPQLEIITKDGEVYYTPATRWAGILNSLKNEKFIEINGEIISCFLVMKVRPAHNRSALADFPPEIRTQVKERAKEWAGKLNKQPPLEKMIEWAERLTKGESIQSKT